MNFTNLALLVAGFIALFAFYFAAILVAGLVLAAFDAACRYPKQQP
ncbi:MAG: hypothetical protein QM612_02795 [Thermomonas sp.]